LRILLCLALSGTVGDDSRSSVGEGIRDAGWGVPISYIDSYAWMPVNRVVWERVHDVIETHSYAEMRHGVSPTIKESALRSLW
jgi:hypothetical protein